MEQSNNIKILQNATPLPANLQPENKIDKQIKTNIEKKHIGGFNTHPENINREGRPKRRSLTEEVYQELLRKGKFRNPETGQIVEKEQFKALAEVIVRRAISGKFDDMRKEVWHYLDGMPKQKTEISGPDDEPLVVEIVEHKEKTNE